MHRWLVTTLVLSALTVVNTAEILDRYWRNVGIEIFSAIKLYNTNYAFKLVEAFADETPPDVGIAREVHFTIQETVCFNPLEKRLEDCDFKDGGAVIDCTVYVPEEQFSRIRTRCKPRRQGMQPVTPKNTEKIRNQKHLVSYFLCCTLRLCSCSSDR